MKWQNRFTKPCKPLFANPKPTEEEAFQEMRRAYKDPKYRYQIVKKFKELYGEHADAYLLRLETGQKNGLELVPRELNTDTGGV